MCRMENTTVARSSDDFWPQDHASHTTHVAVNSYNSLFMGALVQPDWDMFHSRHPAALLHATARVVRPPLPTNSADNVRLSGRCSAPLISSVGLVGDFLQVCWLKWALGQSILFWLDADPT